MDPQVVEVAAQRQRIISGGGYGVVRIALTRSDWVDLVFDRADFSPWASLQNSVACRRPVHRKCRRAWLSRDLLLGLSQGRDGCLRCLHWAVWTRVVARLSATGVEVNAWEGRAPTLWAGNILDLCRTEVANWRGLCRPPPPWAGGCMCSSRTCWRLCSCRRAGSWEEESCRRGGMS